MEKRSNIFELELVFMNGILGSCVAQLPTTHDGCPEFQDGVELSFKLIHVNCGHELMTPDFAMKVAEGIYMSGLITHEMNNILNGIYFDGEKATPTRDGLQLPEYKILDGAEYYPEFKFHTRFGGFMEDPEGWDGDPVELKFYVLGDHPIPALANCLL